VLSDQDKLMELQKALNMLNNPALKHIAPSLQSGIVVSHTLVSKLEMHETPVHDTLVPGLYSMKGSAGQKLLITLLDDGSLVGVSEYDVKLFQGSSVNGKSQVVGTHKDLQLQWIEMHTGSPMLFTGTFLPGGSMVTGTFSTMSGKQGAFDLHIFNVHILNPLKSGIVPHDYMRALPQLTQTHKEFPFHGSLQAGFFVARGKAVNSQTGKETNTPDLLLNLRDDGSLVGQTAFLKRDSGASTVVRVGGVWNDKGFTYSFLYGGKAFEFTGFLVPSTQDIVGGDYRFGKDGKGQGRFAFHMKRADFPAQSNLDHTSSGSSISGSSPHESSEHHLNNTDDSGPPDSEDSDDDDESSLHSNASGSTPHASSPVHVSLLEDRAEFSPAITSSRPGNFQQATTMTV